jgi:hypothetical protein
MRDAPHHPAAGTGRRDQGRHVDNPGLFGGPQVAIYTVDKQPFHHVPEGMPAFERLPQR